MSGEFEATFQRIAAYGEKRDYLAFVARCRRPCRKCGNLMAKDKGGICAECLEPKPPRTHCKRGHPTTGNCDECRRLLTRARYKRHFVPKIRVLNTYCKNGHEYTPENTIMFKTRHCRECRQANVRKWTAIRKARRDARKQK